MPNALQENEIELQRFAEYLLQKRLVPEGHARYYVFWVRLFFQKAPADPHLSLTERLDQYLLAVQGEQRYADWQITQAERAVRLYYFNFQNDSNWKSAPEKRIIPGADGSIHRIDTLAETRRVLRLRHYSYRTEQTYLEWIGGRGRPPSILRNGMQILAHNGGPTAPAAKRDMLGHINRPKDEFGGRGRPPSIFRNGMQILAHDGGPTAPAAAGIMTDHPTRLTLAHPQPVERFNEPIVLFVTICADKQENLFNKKPVQAAILDAWRMATQWRVGLYMLMPNHIHLFCVPGVLNPEPVSKWAAYWKRLSGQYERQLVGVWQRDVWDTQMRTLAQYEEKLSYVRMNPVRKGLVVRPEEWPYSGIVNSIVW